LRRKNILCAETLKVRAKEGSGCILLRAALARETAFRERKVREKPPDFRTSKGLGSRSRKDETREFVTKNTQTQQICMSRDQTGGEEK